MASLAWFLENNGLSDKKEDGTQRVIKASDKSIIIFCLTRKIVLTVYLTLKCLGFRSVPLYGKLDQNKRLAALHKFKKKERNILIATDVASRFVTL